MKLKKFTLKKLIVLIVAVLLLAAYFVFDLHFPIKHSYAFWSYKEDYEYFVDIFYDRFNDEIKQTENLSHVIIANEGNELSIRYFYTDSTPILFTNEAIPDGYAQRWTNVRNAIPKDSEGRGGFEYIIISEGQMSFSNGTAQFAVVYSPWSRPTKIVGNEKNEKIKADQRSFFWYGVTNKTREFPGKSA